MIDGGSVDGALEKIHAARLDNAVVLSEPDQGLYDALNKGLELAQGDVIGFLHADDFLADNSVLADVAARFDSSGNRIDACYGDLVYVRHDNPACVVRYWKSNPYDPRRFYHGWMPPHPTFFARRRVYKQYGNFNLEMGTAADYELMLRFLLKYGLVCRYIPRILVKMRTGGVSNASLANRLRAHSHDHRAWRVNGLRPAPWTLYLKPLSKIVQYLRPYSTGRPL